MAHDTPIECAHHTHNPWWGCTKVNQDCEHCYAWHFASVRLGLPIWGPGADRRFFNDKHWDEPLRWNRKAEARSERHRVFCASMADVFEDRPDLQPQRRRLWKLISATPHLDWLLLTKRPGNIPEMFPWFWNDHPQQNVWLGTTSGHQKAAAQFIKQLTKVPARVHFLSVEPLLEQVRLDLSGIDWVICGGESGPKARPMNPDWARSVRDQCQAAGVAFFFKQWGTLANNPDRADPTAKQNGGHAKGGRRLDGRTWDELPAGIQPSTLKREVEDAKPGGVLFSLPVLE